MAYDDDSTPPLVIPLDELPAHLATRRAFCQTAAVSVIAIGLPGCFGGGGGGGLSIGGLDDDGGPAAIGGSDGGARDLHTSGGPADLAQGGGPVDLAQGGGPVDLKSAPVDLTQPVDLTMPQSTCPGGVTSTGKPPSSFALDTATFFKSDSVFICHDAQGLYALSSSCTHSGCDVAYKSTSGSFHCPCHGANFTYNGDVISGPNGGPLPHLVICLDGSGHVAYDPNTTAPSSVRL